jgi:hypothetical protein
MMRRLSFLALLVAFALHVQAAGMVSGTLRISSGSRTLQDAGADYDSDGYPDAEESGALLADADLSGRVDGFDLAWMGREWATQSVIPTYDGNGDPILPFPPNPDFVPDLDLTRDGTVDGQDLAVLAAYFGREPTVAPVEDCPQAVTLPAFDPLDPEMRLVTNLTELDTALAEDVPMIFVAPGEYFVDTGSVVRLRASGTESQRRYLVYHDPDDPTDTTHPVHMSPDKRAVFKAIQIIGGSYWVLDRLTLDGGIYSNFIAGAGEEGRADVEWSSWIPVAAGTTGPFTPANHNILNRMLYQNTSEDVVVIFEGCHDNTIQNSVLRKNTLPDNDWVGIDLLAWRGRAGSAEITGTCIANNEIYDINDGIQLVNHADFTAVPDYRGTTIVDNDIYVTPDIYTDGQGNLTPDGTYSASENAIDVKAGGSSAAPADWVRIENNRMWGFRYLDRTIAGSNDHGHAVVIHDPVGNLDQSRGYILFKGNIIMDTVNGLSVWGNHHVSIQNNIFHDIKRLGHDGITEPYDQSLALTTMGAAHEVYNNLFLNGDFTWIWTPEMTDVDFVNNLIVDFPAQYVGSHSGITADYNAYFNAPQLVVGGTHDTISASSVVPGHATRYVTRKQWTGPEVVEIPYGALSQDSPLLQTPPEVIGSRPDVGVDDEPVETGTD